MLVDFEHRVVLRHRRFLISMHVVASIRSMVSVRCYSRLGRN